MCGECITKTGHLLTNLSTKGWKEKMVKTTRQYKVASDGKVYFVEGGLLEVLDTMEEYEKLIAFNDKIASTYFEITVGDTYYKHRMVDRDGVFRILANIKNFEQRIEETRRYLKEKEEAGL